MAKRITKSSINWVELQKRVPPEQKNKFYAFKGKSEAYLRRMLSSPADLPKIDWEHYKKVVSSRALVEKFQAEYAAVKIPYPEDKVTPSIDKQWAELQLEITKFTKEMKEQIGRAEKEIARIEALPKWEDITMEMFYDTYPNLALNSVNKPTFWPHTEDEQLGYVDPTQKV